MSRGRKDVASAEHHYFPKALQKYWKDDEGWVHRLRFDGKLGESKNGTFGQVRNAYRIKISDQPSPWDESFEYIFRSADSGIPKVVALLSEVEAPIGVEEKDWRLRLAPQWQLENDRTLISEVVASLVVRSPCLRNLISVGLDDFWERFGGKSPWPKGEVPSHLIAANQRPLFEQYARALASRGKFAVLLTDHKEFVFGDGMLNNFRHGGGSFPWNPRCLVPLTPTVAVAYDCPSHNLVSANFAAIRLSSDEVDEVNWCTQVYSGEYLYYRSRLPAELSSFHAGEHRQL